jgi:hypothetical protein
VLSDTSFRPVHITSSLRCGEQKGYTNRSLLSVMKKCVAEFIGTFALVFAGTVNPSTIRLSGKSEWRGDAIFLRSNVRMLRMKFLAAQSERLPYGHSEARAPCRVRRPLLQVPVTDGMTWYRVVWRGCCGRSGLTRCGSRLRRAGTRHQHQDENGKCRTKYDCSFHNVNCFFNKRFFGLAG